MSIPDAAIEAAAISLSKTWDEAAIEPWKFHARAAIEAAMPAIREAIAQEIEAETQHDDDYYGMSKAARIVRGGAA